MRTFRYRCPGCRQPFAVEEIALGLPVACPHCKQKIQIPAGNSTHTMRRAAPPAGEAFSPPIVDPELPTDAPEVGESTIGISPPSVSTDRVDYDVNRKGAKGPPPDPMAPVAIQSTDSSFVIPEQHPEIASAKVLVEDRPRKIVYKGKVIELRRLSPEEKHRRRVRRRVIMIFIGALVLIGYLLFKVGKV